MTPGRAGLLDDLQNLTVLWRPVEPEQPPRLLSAGERASTALIAACDLLSRRGPAPSPWITPFRQDPIAFLLDTTSNPVNLWGPLGTLVYRNRAAEHADLGCRNDVAREDFVAGGRRFERRCLRLACGGADYMLEIFHEIH